MFQFERFPYLALQQSIARLEPRRVSPFGYLRLLRSYTPHRSFSQYNTSFFGTRYLGILCVPLFAFRIHHTESPDLLACASRYYLRVVYSTVKTHSRHDRRKNTRHISPCRALANSFACDTTAYPIKTTEARPKKPDQSHILTRYPQAHE